MIRQAALADLDTLTAFIPGIMAETSYCGLAFDLNRARAFIEEMITENRYVAVIEKDGEIIGGMVGDLYQPWYSTDFIGIEHSIYVLPAHRNGRYSLQLIKCFIDWCRENGAKQIRPGIASGNWQVNRLYQAIGFTPVGANFLMEL